MPVRNENRGENRQRLLEIMEVMRRHEIVKGITPEKLCAIIEGAWPHVYQARADSLHAVRYPARRLLRRAEKAAQQREPHAL